jgi:hypothetical protein
MRILNIHEREFRAAPDKVGALIDSLSSSSDRLWPRLCWPAMQFDRPLSVGAVGGHGPIRYAVECYTPGQSVRFCFLAPKGFDGSHCFEIIAPGEQTCILRHTIDMKIRGLACLLWFLAIHPLHDALLEDSLATAQVALGIIPKIRKWPLWVPILKLLLAHDKTRKQRIAAG